MGVGVNDTWGEYAHRYPASEKPTGWWAREEGSFLRAKEFFSTFIDAVKKNKGQVTQSDIKKFVAQLRVGVPYEKAQLKVAGPDRAALEEAARKKAETTQKKADAAKKIEEQRLAKIAAATAAAVKAPDGTNNIPADKAASEAARKKQTDDKALADKQKVAADRTAAEIVRKQKETEQLAAQKKAADEKVLTEKQRAEKEIADKAAAAKAAEFAAQRQQELRELEAKKEKKAEAAKLQQSAEQIAQDEKKEADMLAEIGKEIEKADQEAIEGRTQEFLDEIHAAWKIESDAVDTKIEGKADKVLAEEPKLAVLDKDRPPDSAYVKMLQDYGKLYEPKGKTLSKEALQKLGAERFTDFMKYARGLDNESFLKPDPPNDKQLAAIAKLIGLDVGKDATAEAVKEKMLLVGKDGSIGLSKDVLKRVAEISARTEQFQKMVNEKSVKLFGDKAKKLAEDGIPDFKTMQKMIEGKTLSAALAPPKMVADSSLDETADAADPLDNGAAGGVVVKKPPVNEAGMKVMDFALPVGTAVGILLGKPLYNDAKKFVTDQMRSAEPATKAATPAAPATATPATATPATATVAPAEGRLSKLYNSLPAFVQSGLRTATKLTKIGAGVSGLLGLDYLVNGKTSIAAPLAAGLRGEKVQLPTPEEKSTTLNIVHGISATAIAAGVLGTHFVRYFGQAYNRFNAAREAKAAEAAATKGMNDTDKAAWKAEQDRKENEAREQRKVERQRLKSERADLVRAAQADATKYSAVEAHDKKVREDTQAARAEQVKADKTQGWRQAGRITSGGVGTITALDTISAFNDRKYDQMAVSAAETTGLFGMASNNPTAQKASVLGLVGLELASLATRGAQYAYGYNGPYTMPAGMIERSVKALATSKTYMKAYDMVADNSKLLSNALIGTVAGLSIYADRVRKLEGGSFSKTHRVGQMLVGGGLAYGVVEAAEAIKDGRMPGQGVSHGALWGSIGTGVFLKHIAQHSSNRTQIGMLAALGYSAAHGIHRTITNPDNRTTSEQQIEPQKIEKPKKHPDDKTKLLSDAGGHTGSANAAGRMQTGAVSAHHTSAGAFFGGTAEVLGVGGITAAAASVLSRSTAVRDAAGKFASGVFLPAVGLTAAAQIANGDPRGGVTTAAAGTGVAVGAKLAERAVITGLARTVGGLGGGAVGAILLPMAVNEAIDTVAFRVSDAPNQKPDTLFNVVRGLSESAGNKAVFDAVHTKLLTEQAKGLPLDQRPPEALFALQKEYNEKLAALAAFEKTNAAALLPSMGKSTNTGNAVAQNAALNQAAADVTKRYADEVAKYADANPDKIILHLDNKNAINDANGATARAELQAREIRADETRTKREFESLAIQSPLDIPLQAKANAKVATLDGTQKELAKAQAARLAAIKSRMPFDGMIVNDAAGKVQTALAAVADDPAARALLEKENPGHFKAHDGAKAAKLAKEQHDKKDVPPAVVPAAVETPIAAVLPDHLKTPQERADERKAVATKMAELKAGSGNVVSAELKAAQDKIAAGKTVLERIQTTVSTMFGSSSTTEPAKAATATPAPKSTENLAGIPDAPKPTGAKKHDEDPPAKTAAAKPPTPQPQTQQPAA